MFSQFVNLTTKLFEVTPSLERALTTLSLFVLLSDQSSILGSTFDRLESVVSNDLMVSPRMTSESSVGVYIAS